MRAKAPPPIRPPRAEKEPFEPKGSKYERLVEKKHFVTRGEDGVSPHLMHLYARSLIIVRREIVHLKKLSLVEKLPSKFASDLIGYVRLLGEIKKQQRDTYLAERTAAEEALSILSDEQLEAEVKRILDLEKKK